AKVQAVRDFLVGERLYGTHAVVHQGPMDVVPYTDFMANIVTSELAATPMTECERLVRPHGGLLYLRLADGLKSWTRPALPGAGSWSHFYGDPGNTACSGDTRGTATMRLQWFGRPGPEKMVDRHNKTTSPLYKNGRMIVPGLDFFIAADAYNGTILWEKDVPNSVRIGAMRDSSNMALGDDALFIATGGECLKLDPQSGVELSRLSTATLFNEPDSTWGYVATVDDLVYGSVSRGKAIVRQEVRGRDAIWRRVEPLVVCSDHLFAASTKTDKLAWRYQPESGMIINPTIAIADGRVTFIQSDNPATTTVSNAQIGLGPLLKMASLVALDAKTGATLWKRAVQLHDITDAIYLSSSANTLLVTGSHYRTVSKEERGGRKKPQQALRCRYEVFAFDAETGEQKWYRLVAPNRDWELNGGHGANIQHPALVNGVVYGPGFAMNIASGEDYDGWKWSVSHKCGTISASAKYAFSRFSAEKFCYMFDLKDGSSKPLSKASRPGCWINILPVGGLVLVPEASAGCTCEYSVQSSMAFLPQ
ncbi:MAG: outer membrane protein assembly factor BamB, partial [Rhodothermales bacterium]